MKGKQIHMNIKTLINSIIDLDNENKALKNKLNKYEELNNCKPIPVKGYTVLDEIKEEIFAEGLKESIRYYRPFEYGEIFNKDTRKFIPFEAWIQSVSVDDYSRKNFPKKVKDELNNKEIINLYFPYLKNKYEEMVEEKKVELMQEAKESSED